MAPNIHYQISAPELNAHYFHVQVRIDNPEMNGQELRLPTGIPGSYLIREFAQHIQKVTGSCSGKTVEIKKIDKCTWKCSPCNDVLTISYKVYAFDQSVRSAYLDNTRAFFNGSSVFLAVIGQEDEACSITINRVTQPEAMQWEVATTYPKITVDTKGFGEYLVKDYEQLIDHPVEISKLTQTKFYVSDIKHKMIFTGSHHGDLSRLSKDMQKICAVHVKMFGDLPVERYLFMTLVGTKIYGGLEHLDSTALMCSQHELPQAETISENGKKEISIDYRRFLGLCSHEYFHLWNVKRIKPLAYHESNYSEEAYTSQLWIFEGITSYYDDLALVRSGVITQQSYLELVSETLNRVRNNSGRLNQSLADSSFDTWIKFYRPNENTPNSVVSYYAKGSLAALALDLTLQSKTEGRVSLDDVMRNLWTHYGKKSIGLPEGKFEEICEEISGLKLKTFFDSWIRGVGDQPITSLFISVGIKSETHVDKLDKRVTKHFGCDIEMRGALVFIKTVYSGGAAEIAGLAAGDELIAFDGVKVNRVSLQNLAKQYSPGQKVSLLIFRQERLIETNIRLAQPIEQNWKLQIDKTARGRVEGLRNKWLWQES